MAVIRFRKPHAKPDASEENEYIDDADREETYDQDADLAEDGRPGRKFRSVLRKVLLACLAVGLVIFLVKYSENATYQSASYAKEADFIPQDGTEYMPFAGRILAVSRDGAGCSDTKGNPVWNITYEMQEPIVRIAGDRVAIADYSGSTIYLCDKDNTQGTVSTNLPIRSISVSESGETAAILDDQDVAWVYLYDAEGNTIAYFKTTMEQSGYPLSVAVSPAGELVLISHLTIGTDGSNSSLAFYNFGKVGQNQTENNVSGFNYDGEIFPLTCFMNSETSFAVSDSRLTFFTGADIPQNGANVMFTDQLKGVYYSDKYVGLLFPDTTGEAMYTLKLYTASGSEKSEIPISFEYNQVTISGEQVIVYDAQNISVYRTDGGERFHGVFPEDVRVLVPNDSKPNSFTIVTSSDIESMVLQ